MPRCASLEEGWCSDRRRENIIKHIFDKTDGYIKNKVVVNNVRNNTVNKYEIKYDVPVRDGPQLVQTNVEKIEELCEKYPEVSPDFVQNVLALKNDQLLNRFQHFYELCKTDKFGITEVNIIEYLKIANRRKFLERIRKVYVLDTDYIIIKLKQKSKKNVTHQYDYIIILQSNIIM